MTDVDLSLPRETLLKVDNLTARFIMKRGTLTAVEGSSFSICRGETFGLVGESGSGKSVTALSIMRLNPSPPAVTSGQILFDGENLGTKTEREMQFVRGRRIAMIFQEPMTSLNPTLTIGRQIAEGMCHHLGTEKSAARARGVELLSLVGIPSASERMDSYPHELSGGMRQRVMIAMALSCSPPLLIADEPTTALDVTVQAQFLNLLREMIRKFRMALFYISHNLYVVAQVCEQIGVMYAARIVEMAGKESLFSAPRHPYTIGLMNSMPRRGQRGGELKSIKGTVCSLIEPSEGCRFHPRCPKARDVCRREIPAWDQISEKHFVACHLVGK